MMLIKRLMLKKKVLLPVILGGLTYMSISSLDSAVLSTEQLVESSPQFRDGKFVNTQPIKLMDWRKSLQVLKRYITDKREHASPSTAIPVESLSVTELEKLPNNQVSVVRMGHSTMLLKIAGDYWLTDPVFSKRASPFKFFGPKRFHQPPMLIDELPNIKGVIISHNHYDHLDKNTIRKLNEKVENFYVPLGNAADLIDWGVKQENVTELDWWQSTQVGPVKLVATPSQHFSGRGLRDSNKALWSSWVILTPEEKIFFSGDSGYFSGFKEIGEKYGPFDLTIMETGAYDKDWPDVHMAPEQTLQAHIDVAGKLLLPVHNGTFELALHDWFEPLQKITKLGIDNNVNVVTPKMGQVITVGNQQSITKARDLNWWSNDPS